MDDLDRGIAACPSASSTYHRQETSTARTYRPLRASDLMDLVCRTCTGNFWDPMIMWPGRPLDMWKFGYGGQ
jgi:hypothetical protein